MAVVGTIRIDESGIHVEVKSDVNGMSGAAYTYIEPATIENLDECARTLAAWMELPYADVAKECKRVHEIDQFKAAIRETMDRVAREFGMPDQRESQE